MPSNNNEQVDGDLIRNPEVSYEPRDMNARAAVGFILSLAIAGVVVLIVLWGIYKYLAGPEYAGKQIAPPIGTSSRQLQQEVGGDPALKFPQPRLQPDPVADLNKFRAREDEILNSYGWTDKAHGKVRIPIERAIDVVAKTGLPTRPANAAQPAGAKTPRPPGATGAAGGINVQPGEGKLPPPQQ